MLRRLMITVGLATCLYAGGDSSVKAVKLIQKGERIAKVMCDQKKLPKVSGSIAEVEVKITESQACPSLSKSKLEAVAYYVNHGSSNIAVHTAHIHVPKDAKCPVCGMFVSKYPKWTTMMKHDGKTYYFDGVKDMMKYYVFDGDFIYDRNHISSMDVSDYYTLDKISAKKAFYVLDSDIFGPMGRELIPFKSLKSAQNFLKDHNGKKIVRFNEITGKMLMKLDGLD